MKKILSLIFLLITIISCMKKVDLDMHTGSVSLSIGRSDINNSKAISRAITSDTSKIIISLENVSTQTNVIRIIDYTAGQSYSVTIDNMEEGKWDLHIVTYSDSAATVVTGRYFDIIDIVEGQNTVITHEFGLPKPVLNAAIGRVADWSGQDAPFTGNGEIITNSFGMIGFINEGSTYNIGGTYNSNPVYDNIDIKFYLSKDPEMKKDFVQYYDGYDNLDYYPTSSIYSSVADGGNYGKIFITIASSVSNNTFDSLENKTTYYWKAKLTNSIGTTETKIFSFKTEMP